MDTLVKVKDIQARDRSTLEKIANPYRNIQQTHRFQPSVLVPANVDYFLDVFANKSELEFMDLSFGQTAWIEYLFWRGAKTFKKVLGRIIDPGSSIEFQGMLKDEMRNNCYFYKQAEGCYF